MLLLRCAWLLRDAAETPIEDGAVLVCDGHVLASGRFSELRDAYPDTERAERRDLAVLPGFVDAHSHGRGLPREALDLAGAPLERFLVRLAAASVLDPAADALVAAGALLTTGVTTVQLFLHAFTGPQEYVDDARRVAAACSTAGIGCELVLGFTDHDEFLPPNLSAGDAPDALARTLLSGPRQMTADDYLTATDVLRADSHAGAAHAGTTLGPVAPQWCSEAVLRGVAERAAGGARVHTHLLETATQAAAVGHSHPLALLRDAGLLSERLSAAHCVWLDADGIATLARHGVVAVHNPGSNTRLESGRAPVRELLDAGVAVGFGIDSDATTDPPDVFAELRLARAIAAERGRPISAAESVVLATSGSAAALGQQGVLGTLRPGARADLTLVRPPRRHRDEDPLEALMSRADRTSIEEVWVGGRAVVAEGRLHAAAACEHARAGLLDALAADAPRRRTAMSAIAAIEPWVLAGWLRERGVDLGV